MHGLYVMLHCVYILGVLSPLENLPAMKTRSPQSAPSSPVKQKTPFKRYLSFDTTTKKKRSYSSSSKAPEVRKVLKLSPSEGKPKTFTILLLLLVLNLFLVPESEVKEFEDQFYALLGKFPSNILLECTHNMSSLCTHVHAQSCC